MSEWASALTFLLLSFAMGAGMLLLARVLRVRARASTPLKRATYECGEDPEGDAWIQFHPRYYVVALVFVLFDVEAVFLFPWALSLREVGGLAIVDMAVFIVILLLGWIYALKKGALNWQ